jgi:type IV secretion system protein VirD4
MADDRWDNDNGIYVGCSVANLPPDPPPPSEQPVNLLDGEWRPSGGVRGYKGERHIALFGPMGSGKSRRFLMVNLCRLVNWSTVVIDTKGELCAHTAAHRAKHGSVLVIDPFGVMPASYPALVKAHPWLGKSHGLNPMASLDPGLPRFVDDCRLLAEALIKADSKEKHWGQSGQALVKGLLMVLKLKFGDQASLSLLRELVGREAVQLGKFNEKAVADYGQRFPAVASALNRFTKITAENRELFSILSTVLTQSDWLDSLMIQPDLSKGSFPFETLKTGYPFERRDREAAAGTGDRRPVTVYLILPPDYLESHGTWLRVVLASILMPLMRDAKPGAGEFPVLFALDEYAALGHMEIIERNMAMMRGYGVKLLLILQDLAQLQEVHEKRWESFIANAGIRLLFAPQDYTTQEYFSKLSGQSVWSYTSASSNAGESFGTGNFSASSGTTTGEHKQLVPRYTAEHLGSMRRGQALLFIAESRTGEANQRRPVILPDPQSLEAAHLLPEVEAVMSKAQQTINGG